MHQWAWREIALFKEDYFMDITVFLNLNLGYHEKGVAFVSDVLSDYVHVAHSRNRTFDIGSALSDRTEEAIGNIYPVCQGDLYSIYAYDEYLGDSLAHNTQTEVLYVI